MDHELAKKLESFSLNTEETTPIDIVDDDLTFGVAECKMSLYAIIKGTGTIHPQGFKTAMGKAWKCGSFNIQSLQDNIFQLFFGSDETVQYVLTEGPWNYENRLVILRPWVPNQPLSALDFSTDYFWIHVTGLPRICYTREVGAKIAKSF